MLDAVAPAFVEMAHRIVWAVAATTDPSGSPRTRVLHPVWEWDGQALTGWVATSPSSPKAAHLDATPQVSFTYWDATQDTCTADCDVRWLDADEKVALWRRLESSPPPVGYDPSMIPGWDAPDAPAFGGLELIPRRLRVMPGTLPLEGTGELLTWYR